ncbi:Cytochrome b-c1 complex subunit 7 [Irineochytrium annulatum]|nr:Cytochrome b-c1 complex subunit 7 [Irineochytrium annulatum]
MGYRKMGLRFDDLIPDETDIVKEAIRRLPQREMQDRIFRFRRALNLSNNHNALEKSEWTKPEEDVNALMPVLHGIDRLQHVVKQLGLDDATSAGDEDEDPRR